MDSLCMECSSTGGLKMTECLPLLVVIGYVWWLSPSASMNDWMCAGYHIQM